MGKKIQLLTWITGCLLILGILGCERYPTIQSKDTVRIVKQLYTACNTQNSERLAKVRAEFDRVTAAGTWSGAERDKVESILKQAEAGDWANAAQRALEFLKAQEG